MGKIIALLIAVVMLAGCSTVEDNSSYIDEMRKINEAVSFENSVVLKILRTDLEPSVFEGSMKVSQKSLLSLAERAGKNTPPSDFKEAHQHYVNHIKYLADAATAAMENNKENYNVASDALDKERKLMQPIMDEINKGE